MHYQVKDGQSLDVFLKAICKDRLVYGLESDSSPDSDAQDQYHLVAAKEWDSEKHTLGAYRAVEPLKTLLFRPREYLGKLGSKEERKPLPESIVIGVKNCDLSALQIHDYVMVDTEPVDPIYKEAREKTTLVSCDCTDCLDVCFCPVVGEQPYAKEGFDINISPVGDKYVIETGSKRGEKLAEAAKDCLEPAADGLVAQRDRMRESVEKKLNAQAAEKGLKSGMDLQKAIEKSTESKLWDDFAEDCVECGACNFVCCTCHCFLLADGHAKDRAPARAKMWDSCLFQNFARVAGGANLRPHRAERLLNRFDKKFSFFPDVLKTYACDGCGRCAEACTGKIDIRDVLKRAVDES